MSERVILVVDDEEAQRKVLGGFLRKKGFEVITAGGAAEALESASARTVDLVLTDLRMPGGGGLELLRGLRGLPRQRPRRAHLHRRVLPDMPPSRGTPPSKSGHPRLSDGGRRDREQVYR